MSRRELSGAHDRLSLLAPTNHLTNEYVAKRTMLRVLVEFAPRKQRALMATTKLSPKGIRIVNTAPLILMAMDTPALVREIIAFDNKL